MKRLIKIMYKIFILLFLLHRFNIFAELPNSINYQGRYFENGEPVTGTRDNCYFKITNEAGTVTYYSTGPLTLNFYNGLFNYQIPCSTVAWGSPPSGGYYLQVEIAGNVIGREKILSVPYSFYATSATYAFSSAGAEIPPSISVSTINATATTPYGGINITTNVFITATSDNASQYLLKVATGIESGSEKFVVQANGFVGIMTGGPDDPLTIKGGHSWGTAITLDATSLSGGHGWRIFSSGGDASEGQGKFVIQDKTGGGNRLTIDSSGNVGIGTTEPTSILHVKSADTIAGAMRVDNPEGTEIVYVSTTGKVGIGTISPQYPLDIQSGVLRVGSLSSAIHLEPQSGFHRISFDELRFWDWSYNDDMVIFKDGNVGIGTTAPSCKFDVVDGSITVRGTNAGIIVVGGTVTAAGFVGSGAGLTGIVTNPMTSKLIIDLSGNTGPLGRDAIEIHSSADNYYSTLLTSTHSFQLWSFGTNNFADLELKDVVTAGEIRKINNTTALVLLGGDSYKTGAYFKAIGSAASSNAGGAEIVIHTSTAELKIIAYDNETWNLLAKITGAGGMPQFIVGESTYSSFIDLKEIATPANPLTNRGRLFAKDVAGATALVWRTSDGNEIIFSTAQAFLSGSGTTNRVAKFTGSTTIGDSNIEDTGSLITLQGTSAGTAVNNGAVYINNTDDSAYRTIVGLATAGTQKFRFDNDGDFEVSGHIIGLGRIKLGGTDYTFPSGKTARLTVGGTDTDYTVYISTSSDFSSPNLIMTNTGRVAIGTSADVDGLTVGANVYAKGNLRVDGGNIFKGGTATANSHIYLGDATATNTTVTTVRGKLKCIGPAGVEVSYGITAATGTFSSWTKTPVIQDTGGTARITLATTGDNVTLSGQTKVSGQLIVTGSATVQGAGGLGVTYGITAGTLTLTANKIYASDNNERLFFDGVNTRLYYRGGSNLGWFTIGDPPADGGTERFKLDNWGVIYPQNHIKFDLSPAEIRSQDNNARITLANSGDNVTLTGTSKVSGQLIVTGSATVQAAEGLQVGTRATGTGTIQVSRDSVDGYWEAETNPRWQLHRDMGGAGLAGIGFGPGGNTAIDTKIWRMDGGQLRTNVLKLVRDVDNSALEIGGGSDWDRGGFLKLIGNDLAGPTGANVEIFLQGSRRFDILQAGGSWPRVARFWGGGGVRIGNTDADPGANNLAVDGQTIIFGSVTVYSDMLVGDTINNTNKDFSLWQGNLYLGRRWGTNTYFTEGWGIEAYGAATQPFQIRNASLVMGDATGADYGTGRIYPGTDTDRYIYDDPTNYATRFSSHVFVNGYLYSKNNITAFHCGGAYQHTGWNPGWGVVAGGNGYFSIIPTDFHPEGKLSFKISFSMGVVSTGNVDLKVYNVTDNADIVFFNDITSDQSNINSAWVDYTFPNPTQNKVLAVQANVSNNNTNWYLNNVHVLIKPQN